MLEKTLVFKGKPRNTRKYLTNPEIPECKKEKIPGNTRSYFSTLLPDPNPTRYPVFCPIPDPSRPDTEKPYPLGTGWLWKQVLLPGITDILILPWWNSDRVNMAWKADNHSICYCTIFTYKSLWMWSHRSSNPKNFTMDPISIFVFSFLSSQIDQLKIMLKMLRFSP